MRKLCVDLRRGKAEESREVVALEVDVDVEGVGEEGLALSSYLPDDGEYVCEARAVSVAEGRRSRKKMTSSSGHDLIR